MRSNKRTMINLVCSFAVLITNILIGFFLSPYIIKTVGVEANGFVTLANNFVTYANLIVTALNSMAARFITLSYIKKDYKQANKYYNAVFWGNLIIVAVLLLPAVCLILRLETVLDIPTHIVWDVKFLFVFVFFNFFIATGLPNWDCGTYITNRLDRTYIPNMVSSVFRCVFLVLIFNVFTPHVWYVGLASSLVVIINLVAKGYNTHVLTPELKVGLKKGTRSCSWKAIKELVGSGIWNSISSVGNLLLNGLDLIICNIFIDSTAMGIIALSKTLPAYMQQFSASITQVFAPELMINYAKGDKEVVLRDINRAMKITSVLLVIPLVGIIVMSKDFYHLWVPSQDANTLSKLTIITCLGYAFTSGTQILYNVFPTVNKVRTNAIYMVLSGVASTILVFILLKTTNLGIYAIAGCSVFTCWIRNMLYTVPYAAKYLGYKKTQFYPQVVSCFTNTMLLSIIGTFIRGFFEINNWIQFLGVATLIGSVCLVVGIMVFLKKEERDILLNKVFGRIRRR